MVTKATIDGRGYQFRLNYYKSDVPIEIFIRDEGLIGDTTVPTSDNMFVAYSKFEIEANTLKIKGTAFNVGLDYSELSVIEKKVSFRK